MRVRGLIGTILFLSLARAGAPDATAHELTGAWEWQQPMFTSLLVLNADGSGRFDEDPITYSVTGDTLSMIQGGERLDYKFRVEGGSLVLSGGDLDDTANFVRQGGSPAMTRESSEAAQRTAESGPGRDGPTARVAGVWVCEESSLDPQYYMSFTQYVTLFPDGTVGYAKVEGGATRTHVTESIEQFRSWRSGAQGGGGFGRWQTDGASVTVFWNRWNNLVSSGQVDANSGMMTLSGMGVLEEGSTLTFKRQS